MNFTEDDLRQVKEKMAANSVPGPYVVFLGRHGSLEPVSPCSECRLLVLAREGSSLGFVCPQCRARIFYSNHPEIVFFDAPAKENDT